MKKFTPNNMQNMMKQVQKLQKEMMEKKDQVENELFEGTSGGGVVRVTVSGKKEVTKITIDKEVVDPEDIETLEDLLIAAINDAMKEADKKMESSMGQFSQGLGIPGLF